MWFCSIAFGLFWFAQSQLVTFDDNASLQQKSVQAELLSTLGLTPNRPTLVHFYQNDCRCDGVSAEHIARAKRLATEAGFAVSSFDASQFKNLIPATPAVMLINASASRQQKSPSITYLGPYGAGLGCSDTSGFIDTALNNLSKGFDSQLVISKVRGCYCKTS